MTNKQKIVFITVTTERKSIWDILAMQSYGVLILAQILRSKGYSVKIIADKAISYSQLSDMDYICFSFYSSASNKAYRISENLTEFCKINNKKVPVRIMGGIHPTYCADEVLNYCDYVVRGEGEVSLPALLKELSKRNPDLSRVKGLSYKNKERIIHNSQGAMIEDKELLQTSPAQDFNPYKKRWHRVPVLTPARGCPYNCDFCSQPFGHKIRLSNPEWMVDELENIVRHKYYSKSRSIFIGSDNFAMDKKWTKHVLRLCLKRGLKDKISLHVQTRTDIAHDEELLDLMHQFVGNTYIGIESFDTQTLRKMGKGISGAQMQKELTAIIGAGVHVHAHFIFGTDFDTPDSILKTVKLAKEMGVSGISLFTFTPFPGTKLREEMLEQKRVITDDWSYYNLHYITMAPLLGRPSHFQAQIDKGYQKFYSFSNIWRSCREACHSKIRRGLVAPIYNGMFWLWFLKPNQNTEKYIRFLKHWEKDRYRKDNIFRPKLS